MHEIGFRTLIKRYQGLPACNQGQPSSTKLLWNFDNSFFFLARQLSPKFFPFTNDNHATPVQDMAQQRHRRRRAAGTRPKVSF